VGQGWARFVARRGRWLIILPPLLFLFVFFLIPFGFALKISFGEAALRIPPFTDLIGRAADGHPVWQGTWTSYRYLITDDVYLVSVFYSVRTALMATLLCLLVGYPMAYAMSRARKSTQNILMMVIILPFWTSFLLRVYALESLIRDNGLVNAVLLQWGVIDHPLRMMHTSFAIYLGIVYSYLPFMVLPLYATLEKMDRSLLEAASDLGSRPWRAFLDVTLPLSVPGIVAGSMLVFIPAVGEYVIPALLGGPDNLMIGRVLWDEFFGNHDWPVASAVAIAFLVLLAGPIAIHQYYRVRQEDY
jgi:putrescine transport system permease protein